MYKTKLSEENAYLTEMLRKAGVEAEAHLVAARLQNILIDEIHHRTKNMLAVITAIVRQSMRSASSLTGAEAAIGMRLAAMAKAHEILLKADLKVANLADVVRGAIEQHDTLASRISMRGQKVEIMPSAIIPITLIINELCTNATKYGALSVAEGSVDLAWTMSMENKVLVLRWVEKGGPVVYAPRIKNLGSRLIEEAIPRQLGGKGCLMFEPSGVEFELKVPYEAVRPQVLG